MRSAFTDAIVTHAAFFGLDPDMVEALVLVESSGNPWAFNPEPKYPYLWNVKTKRPFRPLASAEAASKTPPADFPCLEGDRDQEWWGQQASWGLMQVMGAVARERGFTGLYLTELCDPLVNLSYGCGHLSALLEWARGDIARALGAWNAGKGNALSAVGRAYTEKVLTTLEKL